MNTSYIFSLTAKPPIGIIKFPSPIYYVSLCLFLAAGDLCINFSGGVISR